MVQGPFRGGAESGASHAGASQELARHTRAVPGLEASLPIPALGLLSVVPSPWFDPKFNMIEPLATRKRLSEGPV